MTCLLEVNVIQFLFPVNHPHGCHCHTDLDVTAADVHTTDHAAWGVQTYPLYPVDHLLLIVKVQSPRSLQVLSHHSSVLVSDSNTFQHVKKS